MKAYRLAIASTVSFIYAIGGLFPLRVIAAQTNNSYIFSVKSSGKKNNISTISKKETLISDRQTSNSDICLGLDCIERKNSSSSQDTNDQVNSVSQLSDVKPTDWAFQALRSLVERYGCIAGYIMFGKSLTIKFRFSSTNEN